MRCDDGRQTEVIYELVCKRLRGTISNFMVQYQLTENSESRQTSVIVFLEF